MHCRMYAPLFFNIKVTTNESSVKQCSFNQTNSHQRGIKEAETRNSENTQGYTPTATTCDFTPRDKGHGAR